MSDERHLDNYLAIKAAALKPIRCEVVGFVLVAVDDKGDVYWGANYSSSKELLPKLEHMTRECRKAAKQQESA